MRQLRGIQAADRKETDVNNGWIAASAAHVQLHDVLDADVPGVVPKTDAGKYCWNPWPYWDPMTAPEEQQTDNFNTGGFMCKSGLCGGGGTNSMSMSMSMSYCSYDPMTGYGGDQNYCCNDAAAAAGCKKPCDKTTGACTTKSMPGETCTSSADCFNDRACLGGRCCAFAACDHTAQAPPPPPPGGYDPYGYGGMYYYEDKQRYPYRAATSARHQGEGPQRDGTTGHVHVVRRDERPLIGTRGGEHALDARAHPRAPRGVLRAACSRHGEEQGGGALLVHYQWDPITERPRTSAGLRVRVAGAQSRTRFFTWGT